MNTMFVAHAFDPAKIRHNWGWFLALGIALCGVGLLALAFTFAAALVSALALGIILLVGGIVTIVSAFGGGGAGAVILRVLLGIVFLAAAWYLIAHPVLGALSLTLVMAWYFIIGGTIKIIAALMVQHDRWGWSVAGGIVAIVLGILLTAQWPVSGLYAVGLFIGIDCIVSGIIWCYTALTGRGHQPPAPVPAT